MDCETVRSEIDRVSLCAAVRQALGRDTVEIITWQARSIHIAFNQVTGGLFRLTGIALDRVETWRWSLVVKIAQNPADAFLPSADPANANYWKREALVYQSGVLERLPPGLKPPRCFGVSEHPTGSVWLFLEDVAEHVGERWPLERYALAARHLGRFNGDFLTGRPVPTDACLSRGWLRATAESLEPFFERLASVSEHPLVRHKWSPSLLDRQARLYKERHTFLSALSRLPATFCHMDAWRRNLLARNTPDGTNETIAVDWTFTGPCVVGEDLAPLVAADAFFFLREPEDLSALDEVVYAGYLAGLRDTGWVGDARLPRLGYTAAAALRFGCAPVWAAAGDDAITAWFEQSFGHPISDIIDRGARIVRFLCDQADEARELMSALDFT